MIRKIGVVYQDAISYGVLLGLQRRLTCEADLVFPQAAVGRSTMMTKRQARAAYQHFTSMGADLIVRLTDADAERWQDVKRSEIAAFPEEAREHLVCGVADRNIEHWLALAASPLESALGLAQGELAKTTDLSGLLKGAIHRSTPSTTTKSEFVAGYIHGLPSAAFKQWLQCDHFAEFYDDLRASAARHACPVTNER